MSEKLFNSIEYFDEYGEYIYYGYHLPYNGEKVLELTFAADDWVVDYNDYAVYIGFYTIEEINQATYNAGKQKSNETISGGDLYLRITEYAVIGTSLQIAPVDIQYELPSDIEGAEVRVSFDENPYANYLDIYIQGQYDYLHNALTSHLNGVEGYKNYEIEHDLYLYNGYDLSKMDDFIESLVTFSYSSQEGYVINDRKELDSDLLERYGAIKGYRYVGNWQTKEDKEQSYYDEGAAKYTKINFTVDKIRYDEIDIIVLPNGLTHKFTFNKYSEFPDAHFMIEERISNAAFEVEHFLNTLNFVPRNNGMTPEEYGEYIKTNDELSMRLISDS
ncbi:hypothetical protein, partial [Sphaerochaeta sp. S2]|uniref:hypothetical protein n=1 Tax=Sphaerochaeta sp. S2 TaxID=2798868 RepID=UPI0018E95965